MKKIIFGAVALSVSMSAFAQDRSHGVPLTPAPKDTTPAIRTAQPTPATIKTAIPPPTPTVSHPVTGTPPPEKIPSPLCPDPWASLLFWCD